MFYKYKILMYVNCTIYIIVMHNKQFQSINQSMCYFCQNCKLGTEMFLTMFERATLSFGTTSVTSNVAFKAGSSQHGNARLASVGWKKSEFHNLITIYNIIFLHL